MHNKTQVCPISLVFSDVKCADLRYNCAETHNATKSICLPGMQMTTSSERKQQAALEIKLFNVSKLTRMLFKVQNILVG